MRLINTIEINPVDFLPEREKEQIDFMEERAQTWARCFSSGKLAQLRPIQKGSYLVDINTITDDELEEIVKNKLREAELSDFDEKFRRMYGGIVLTEEDTLYIQPSCCTDIGDIVEWDDIHTKATGEWHKLWIGHPWVYYSIEEDTVAFSGYTESTPAAFNDLPLLIRVSRQDLLRELQQIRSRHEHFQVRVQKALEKLGTDDSEQVSKLMTGMA